MICFCHIISCSYLGPLHPFPPVLYLVLMGLYIARRTSSGALFSVISIFLRPRRPRLLSPLASLTFSVPIPTLVYTILFIALFLSFMPPIKASRFLLICYPIFVYFTLCYHRNAYAFSFHNHTQNLLIVVILRQCRKDRKRTFFRFFLLISCSFSFFFYNFVLYHNKSKIAHNWCYSLSIRT